MFYKIKTRTWKDLTKTKLSSHQVFLIKCNSYLLSSRYRIKKLVSQKFIPNFKGFGLSTWFTTRFREKDFTNTNILLFVQQIGQRNVTAIYYATTFVTKERIVQPREQKSNMLLVRVNISGLHIIFNEFPLPCRRHVGICELVETLSN